MTTTTSPNPTGPDSPEPGLTLTTTEPIRSFLLFASHNPDLSQPLRDLAAHLSSSTQLPYKSLRTIWTGSGPSGRPDLGTLLSGSQFLFSSPRPREKSEELKARLKRLEELAERKAYNELVKDVNPRKGEIVEPFSSYKDQLGFGMHVVLTMFTGYLLGYAAFRALFSHSTAMSAAGGILGLVFAMLVETFLFIIRSSNLESRSSASASVTKKNQ